MRSELGLAPVAALEGRVVLQVLAVLALFPGDFLGDGHLWLLLLTFSPCLGPDELVGLQGRVEAVSLTPDLSLGACEHVGPRGSPGNRSRVISRGISGGIRAALWLGQSGLPLRP